jgi:hypothetical protein
VRGAQLPLAIEQHQRGAQPARGDAHVVHVVGVDGVSFSSKPRTS